jgi:hypothetical protein
MASGAQAALIDRGGGLIYDTVLDVTWLQDADYARTLYDIENPPPEPCTDPDPENCPFIPYDPFAGLNFADANAWADGLTYYDSVRDVTWDDWRLPTVGPINGSSYLLNTTYNGTSDNGYALTTTNGSDGGWRDGDGTPVSEMGHMFYVNLMNLGACTATAQAPSTCIQQTNRVLSTGIFLNLTTDPFHAYWSNATASPGDGWIFDPYSGFGARTTNLTRLWSAWAVRDGDVAPSVVPVPAAVWLFGSALGLVSVMRRKLTS